MVDGGLGMHLPGPREGRGFQSFSSRRVRVPRQGQTCGVVLPYGVLHPAVPLGGTPTQRRLSDLFPNPHAFRFRDLSVRKLSGYAHTRVRAQTLRLLDQIEVRARGFPLVAHSISDIWCGETVQGPSSIRASLGD